MSWATSGTSKHLLIYCQLKLPIIVHFYQFFSTFCYDHLITLCQTSKISGFPDAIKVFLLLILNFGQTKNKNSVYLSSYIARTLHTIPCCSFTVRKSTLRAVVLLVSCETRERTEVKILQVSIFLKRVVISEESWTIKSCFFDSWSQKVIQFLRSVCVRNGYRSSVITTQYKQEHY